MLSTTSGPLADIIVDVILGTVDEFVVVFGVFCSSCDEGGVLTSCVCSFVCLVSLEVIGAGGERACVVVAVVVGVAGVTSGDVTVSAGVDNRFFFGLPVQ